MYDQFLAKTFHAPNFGDEQFDAGSQNNNDGGPGTTQVRRASTERQHATTASSDSSDERVQTPSHRLTPVSTGLSAVTETAPRHAPGYPAAFFGSPPTQEQLYNARLSYNQHVSYQQYKQQLAHQMGGYNPLEMLQQGYGMGPPAAPPRLPPPPVQTVPEPVCEEPDEPPVQNQVYAGMKRPSPDNCFLNVQKKPKPQKKKKKRDPNEPQKPVSAYALFFRDTQAAIKGQNPNASFGEVSKIVASMWDTLDVEHKNVYKRKTEDAKKDYLKALAAYRASLVSKSGREAETTTTTTYNSGFAAGGCYNGYSQHGYSPPTSVAGGGADIHAASQRGSHHHQGYSPPPGGMPAKLEHTSPHPPPMHHHGYSQTPGGGVDSRGTQLGHPFGQQPVNQGSGLDHVTSSHRLSHHHHGYSPSSGPSQSESSLPKNQHNAYASSPSGASAQGAFNDNHGGSQDRNSQLGTHYHGYSPPRSISGDVSHQMSAQYVTSGHQRLQTGANSHQVYSNSATGNIADNVQNSQQQSGGGYPGSVPETHQSNMRNVSHHHSGYQLSANSTQVDNRQSTGSQQSAQSHLGYSPSPGGNSQQETHQAGSQTTGYPSSNQSGESHHQLAPQNVSNAYTQSTPSGDRQHHSSPQTGGYAQSSGDGHHHQHAGTQSGYPAQSPSGESHHQSHGNSQTGVYPPTSTSGEQHHQHMNAGHRLPLAHQTYSSSQTTPYNGYSPRLQTSFDGFSSNSPSLPAPSSQGQTLMNQDCVQSQQQQSQVLVGRHMAPPGGQHMTVHQPPPI